FSTVNLNAVCERVAGLLRAAGGNAAAIEARYDPSLPEVDGHADSLVQAVLNLLKNALEAGADRVELRSFYDTAAALHPESGLKLPVTLEISDNGGGMDAETAARLFEPCFTTKPQGEGLGLTIVSRIVDDHGGAMTVASAPGKTVFRMCFPQPHRPKPRSAPA